MIIYTKLFATVVSVNQKRPNILYSFKNLLQARSVRGDRGREAFPIPQLPAIYRSKHFSYISNRKMKFERVPPSNIPLFWEHAIDKLNVNARYSRSLVGSLFCATTWKFTRTLQDWRTRVFLSLCLLVKISDKFAPTQHIRALSKRYYVSVIKRTEYLEKTYNLL